MPTKKKSGKKSGNCRLVIAKAVKRAIAGLKKAVKKK